MRAIRNLLVGRNLVCLQYNKYLSATRPLALGIMRTSVITSKISVGSGFGRSRGWGRKWFVSLIKEGSFSIIGLRDSSTKADILSVWELNQQLLGNPIHQVYNHFKQPSPNLNFLYSFGKAFSMIVILVP